MASFSRNPPLTKRVGSIEAQREAMSKGCIDGFINYLKDKVRYLPSGILKGNQITDWSNTTDNNVEAYLIDLMRSRGVEQLSFPLVKELTDYICSTNKPTRNEMLSILVKWFRPGVAYNLEVSKMRGEMTFDSGLPAATLYMDPKYYQTAFSVKKPAIPLTPDELDWINDIERSTIVGGEKQKCSNCWICGREVYVYNLIDSEGKSRKRKCGEDEHVFPPGLGNVLGFLYPTYNQQVESVTSEIFLTSQGLKSAHAWCNQVKGALGLILPPTMESPTYRINIKSLNNLLATANTWLKMGKNRIVGIDLFHHTMADNPADRKLYLTTIDENVRSTIGIICSKLNESIYNKSLDVPDYKWTRIMYNLRTIFFGCLLGKSIFKNTFFDLEDKWNSFSTPSLRGGRGRYNIKNLYNTPFKQFGGNNFEFSLQLDEYNPYLPHENADVLEKDQLVALFLSDSISTDSCLDTNALNVYEVAGYSLRLSAQKPIGFYDLSKPGGFPRLGGKNTRRMKKKKTITSRRKNKKSRKSKK